MEREVFYMVLKAFAAGSLTTLFSGAAAYVIAKLEARKH